MTVCRVLPGDPRAVLPSEPAESVQTCVSSPPYFKLRDYGVEGQIGMEDTPEEYVEHLVEVFAEVRRVLKPDGTLWVNLGDTYAGGGCGARDSERWPKQARNDHMPVHAKKHTGRKDKDLIGIPWLVAFALQRDGWWLRQDIIWAKPNPMPAPVTDRCVSAHEYLFLLAKEKKYLFNHEAIREPFADRRAGRDGGKRKDQQANPNPKQGFKTLPSGIDPSANGGRNKRSVWTVASEPFKGEHFAVFPTALVEPCVLAGSNPGDVVLDPFSGTGRTGVVALRNGRRYLGTELNDKFIQMGSTQLREAYAQFQAVQAAQESAA